MVLLRPAQLDIALIHPGRREHNEVGPGFDPVNDLFDRHDRALGGKHGFLLHANDAVNEHVAIFVRLLRMYAIATSGRQLAGDRCKFFSRERAFNLLDAE